LAHPVLPHWIDGKPSSASATRVGDIFNPATGQKIAEVAFADAGQVNAAVDSARIASLSWSQVPVTRRSQVFYQFRSLLAEHATELAQLISREHGKTVDDARGEIARGLEVVEFVCGIPQLLKGELSPNVSTGVDLTTVREPLGVVAGITPFNFPAMVGLWMYPVAIACGNAFILKPSERDPSVANRIAELFSEAGLPEGVFNVVHGDRVAVERLLAVSWARRQSLGTFTRRAPNTGNESRPWAAQRITWSCSPTRISNWLRMARFLRPTGLRANAAWRFPWSPRWETAPTV